MPRSLTRRALLFGRASATPEPRAFRPPWARRPEQEFSAACTRCDACIRQCPQQVLVRDTNGLPRFDPQTGECTFCGECVSACASGALDSSLSPPWTLLASIDSICLSARGIVCASCREICPASAIHVPPAARGTALVDTSRCTGCGACVAVCPVDAIRLQHATPRETVA